MARRPWRSWCPGEAAARPRRRGTFTVVFPEGFTREQMAARVETVAASAARASGKPVALTEQGYVAATAHARVPCFGQAVRRNLAGFLFPATYDFVTTTTATQLVAAQLQAFCREWNTVDLSYGRSKNLTPDDVLTIASMIEREVQAPEERPLAAAVVYNRLYAGMPLGLDSTLRYGLHIPATQAILARSSPTRRRTTRGSVRGAANPDRESRAGGDSRRGSPGEGRLSVLRAEAGHAPQLLHRLRGRVLRLRVRAHGYGC